MTSIPGIFTTASVPHGLLACVHSNALHIYSGTTLSLSAHIPLDGELVSRIKAVKFSPRTAEPRVLLVTDTSIHAYDPYESAWHASLANASAPTGRIAHCAFVSGDEVLVFADFGVKATVWNLSSGAGTEVASPKARGSAAYSVRPGSGHLAVLARVSGKDTVVILAPGSRHLEVSVTLESNDAAGVKWSPDGKWLVAWESTALGPGVWVHTAEGQLFRKWMGPNGSDEKGIPMGVRSIEWDANGDWLLLGMGNGTVVGLRSRTFISHFTLSHPSSISVPTSASIWQEQIAAAGGTARDYAVAQQPAIPPSGPPSGTSSSASSSTTSPSPRGITHLVSAPSGSLMASVCAQTPTTVWIHSLPTDERRAPVTSAVLLHHHPVKTLEWSADGTQLLIHCFPSGSSASVVSSGGAMNGADISSDSDKTKPIYWTHIFSSSPDTPDSSTAAETLPIPLPSASAPDAKCSLAWAGAADGPSLVLLSTAAGATLVPVRAPTDAWSGVRITGDGPEDAFDEVDTQYAAEKLDVTALTDTRPGVQVDDTFAFRRGWGTKVL